MKNLREVFAEKKHPLLITYLTMGYPSLEATAEAVSLLEESGADIIELGIPFSDPLVDGTTIQKASHGALQAGATPRRCLKLACELGKKVEVPLLFMTYYNILCQYGLKNFCRVSREAGIQGLIIPDLPCDEGTELEKIASEYGLKSIYLATPSTPEERLREIARRSEGFIYLVSVDGLTGIREGLPPYLHDFVARVRQVTAKPLCLGFGLSTPEQVARVTNLVDGVIVGSGIVEVLGRENWPKNLTRYVRSLKEALMK